MMFQLLLFEFRYHVKQLTFWFLALLAITGGAARFYDINSGPDLIDDNSPYQLTISIGLISLISLFPILIFTISGLMRDRSSKMEPLIFSTPIQKKHFLASRISVVFLMSLLIGSLAVFGYYFGQFLPNIDHSTVTSSQTIHYLLPLGTFLIGNTFIITALVTTIALFTRNALSTAIGTVMLFTIFWMCSFYINSPLTGGSVLAPQSVLDIASLVDLFGLSAFMEQSQFWTPQEKNNLTLSFSGNLLTNRICWISIACLSLMMAYRYFTFCRISKPTKKAIKKYELGLATTNYRYKPIRTEYQTIKAEWLAFRALVKSEMYSLIKSVPFWVMMGIWGIMNFAGFYFIVNGEERFGDRYPTTNLLIGLIAEPLPLFGAILLIFFSGELTWRNRQFQFHEIIGSSPVRNSSFFWSTYLTLAILPFLMILFPILIAIGYQIACSYYLFDFTHYASAFYFFGAQLYLYSAWALFLQAVLPNKYLAMLCTAITLAVFGPFSQTLGLEHPLLLLNQLPSMARAHSDMTGYSYHAQVFHWLALYWFTLAGIITFLIIKIKKRQVAKVSWKPIEISALIIAFFIFISTGAYIFYNTNILNEYTASNHRYDFNENYERAFKKYEALASPQIVDVNTKVAIYPTQKRYHIEGLYVIKNTTDSAINQIFISTPKPYQQLSLTNSKLVFHHKKLNSYLFKLNQALQMGDSLRLHFMLDVAVKGFASSNEITSNGSYIKHSAFNPLLGYADFLEITDPLERLKRGLPKKEEPSDPDQHLTFGGKFNSQKVQFESVVSTSVDQLAITSGELVRQWTEHGRNFYHYKTTPKVHGNMAYFSANYEIIEDYYKGINLQLYYHPTHSQNIDEMLKATKATIDYCEHYFGKYPHSYLRIAEVPAGMSFGGQAMPGVISMTETAIYTKDISKPNVAINIVARRTIHEVAHQWWGHLLSPKRATGSKVLTESLAKYTEAIVLEKLYGKQMVRKLSQYTMNRYFSGRAFAQELEPPLYLTQKQQYLAYSKGYIILNALKELLGENQLNATLRKLVDNYSATETVTTLDFLAELERRSTPKQQLLIEDWMKKVIHYDLKIDEVRISDLPDGHYQVTAIVEASKFETIHQGESIPIVMDEPISIGFFTTSPQQMKKDEQAIYLQKHKLLGGKNKLIVILNQKPTFIAIDPDLTRLDKNTTDNIMKIE